ncbi:MAG: hypothetical protein JSU78_00835 [Deltaproteobacteria bacterium]|nr:MAG: hypothetical protein JSU78_00835 [Deltaproteobacteria bacterium]
MVITPYQINNVLRVYGTQLRQNRALNRLKDSNTRIPDRISISADAKRQAIVGKIASDIVDKISQYGPHDSVEKEVFKKLEDEYGVNLAVTRKNPNDLIFKVIDENGETINSLSIEDSMFLRYKLEEITKDTVNKNMI